MKLTDIPLLCAIPNIFFLFWPRPKSKVARPLPNFDAPSIHLNERLDYNALKDQLLKTNTLLTLRDTEISNLKARSLMSLSEHAASIKEVDKRLDKLAEDEENILKPSVPETLQELLENNQSLLKEEPQVIIKKAPTAPNGEPLNVAPADKTIYVKDPPLSSGDERKRQFYRRDSRPIYVEHYNAIMAEHAKIIAANSGTSTSTKKYTQLMDELTIIINDRFGYSKNKTTYAHYWSGRRDPSKLRNMPSNSIYTIQPPGTV